MHLKKRFLLLVLVLLLVLQLQVAYSASVPTINKVFSFDILSFFNIIFNEDGSVTIPAADNEDLYITAPKPASVQAALTSDPTIFFIAISEGKPITEPITFTTADGALVFVSPQADGTKVGVLATDGTYIQGNSLKFDIKPVDNIDGTKTIMGTLKAGDGSYNVEVTKSSFLSPDPTVIKVTKAELEPSPPQLTTIFTPEPPTFIPLTVPPTILFCTPQTEVCDGVDNNCNNKIDDYVINDCASEQGF